MNQSLTSLQEQLETAEKNAEYLKYHSEDLSENVEELGNEMVTHFKVEQALKELNGDLSNMFATKGNTIAQPGASPLSYYRELLGYVYVKQEETSQKYQKAKATQTAVQNSANTVDTLKQAVSDREAQIKRLKGGLFSGKRVGTTDMNSFSKAHKKYLSNLARMITNDTQDGKDKIQVAKTEQWAVSCGEINKWIEENEVTDCLIQRGVFSDDTYPTAGEMEITYLYRGIEHIKGSYHYPALVDKTAYRLLVPFPKAMVKAYLKDKVKVNNSPLEDNYIHYNKEGTIQSTIHSADYSKQQQEGMVI